MLVGPMTRHIRIIDDPDILRRAFAGYFRAGGMEQPANTSHHVAHNGHEYVVLENVRGVLAVYRLRNDGKLKRLRRLPAGLVAS